MTDIETAKDLIHDVRGHRICLVQQHLREGNVRQAAVTQGEIEGLLQALRLIEQVEEGDEPDTEDRPLHYHALSEQHRQAEQTVAEDETESEIRGMQ